MSWFRRKKKGILTDTSEQNESPEGLWIKDPVDGEFLSRRELEDHHGVSPRTGHHFRMSSLGYFDLLFDDHTYSMHDEDLFSVDPLSFQDTKPYRTRLEKSHQKTGMNDAARSAMGTIGGHRVAVGAMDFSFIGGSMGSVVGEILSRTVRRAYTQGTPLIIISQSGGARMMEGALSLMQMAKTSAHLAQLDAEGLPFFSILTHPTTGGVTASYAMLGDLNIAEPGALIGFAGPRVIRETIGQDLPPGFQRAEFLEEHGFVDAVVDRRELRAYVIRMLDLLMEPQP
ncbi:MAG: acetyl-CoA carboxylase, carboxyltransferase subunit beta [Bacteroidota bacterium]